MADADSLMDFREAMKCLRGFCPRDAEIVEAEVERLTKALTEIRMLTVEVGDSVEAATRACDIAMEALGE